MAMMNPMAQSSLETKQDVNTLNIEDTPAVIAYVCLNIVCLQGDMKKLG